MILAIDIGNTNTNIGVINNNKIVKVYQTASDISRTEDEYGVLLVSLLKFDNFKESIEKAIISSVVPVLGETIFMALKKYLGIKAFCVSHKSKLPFNIKLDNKKEAGADRLANAAAAVSLYKLPAIVIDIGTATTFDIVDKNKNFIGGIIAPGPKIQARALREFTSKLPKLSLEDTNRAIGSNTVDAMLSGIVLGHRKMIEGMIDMCEKELGEKASIIATGGFSNVLFKDLARPIDFINKNLTLEGLKIILELNEGEK